jgi:hypothetical protein
MNIVIKQMNKSFNIQTLKMLSNNHNSNNIKVHNSENERNNIKPEYENIQDIDYNFCKIYYETNDNMLINRLVSLNGIKTMKMLDIKLPNDFNWKVYSRYCQGITNEILIKKHYLESYNRKLEAEQLLNIIIIKKTKLPIETVILDFNNMKVTLSIISEDKENIEHYNVRKYTIDSSIQNKLNEVIKNNTSKYYMILFDNYNFEYSFVNKICKELDDLIDIESLLLVSDYNSNINMDTNTIEYFRINTNYLRTLTESYVCILNNSIKSDYEYSITDIGLALYINQQLKKYNNTLTSVDFKFKVLQTENNKLLLKDTFALFDIYISNIEDNILDNDINTIIELSNDDTNNQNMNNIQIEEITSTLIKSGELINEKVPDEKIEKIRKSVKLNNKIELDFLIRENNGIINV